MTCAVEGMHQEIAYVAHHLHWSLEDIMDLEHHDRRRYVAAARRLADPAGGPS
ncbi:hypothetical protein GCM10022223_17290 [Kineosporia mesophila]|uniref:DUF6760 domain-containing protein n=1 Tax=Kineosporia mesophila TaxID=566012 RepID=A0ABP6Z9G4_9ACTN|nr:DUF6760 family protein [Kineosporia mesophila]MCD5352032.1 hypothetical protein [Kineosporia mesophila]